MKPYSGTHQAGIPKQFLITVKYGEANKLRTQHYFTKRTKLCHKLCLTYQALWVPPSSYLGPYLFKCFIESMDPILGGL
nr:unnamed protein product [Callosobruchus analis]